ncbi:MAG: nucleoside deaminase [Roseiflexaceae bacterium]
MLLQAENSVVTDHDITAHAETNLVRLAWRSLTPQQLVGCTLYTSTEPCAMCAGAIHWAGIGRVVYGLAESELHAMAGASSNHLMLPCREVFARAQRPITVAGPLLEDEARAVHHDFWSH